MRVFKCVVQRARACEWGREGGGRGGGSRQGDAPVAPRPSDVRPTSRWREESHVAGRWEWGGGRGEGHGPEQQYYERSNHECARSIRPMRHRAQSRQV